MHLRRLAHEEVDALVPSLSSLLIANVAAGASIGFHPPMSQVDAERYWRGVRQGVERGERVMIGAFDAAGALVGTGQLALEWKPNGRHRAEVQKVMVAPPARRQGIARAIMGALVEAAREGRRTLLLLDTREGDAAERLYQSLGWELVGRVPGFVGEHDGTFSATMIYYRSLDDGYR
jgi:GNAT superfamily N-acetyltransferase